MVKISVIIPIFNDEEYLSEAIDSIINQSLDDIEIICVNDGSTDSSLDILNDYAQRFDFVKVFTKDNEGSGIARNFALKKASGQYIAYLDSDDIFVDSDALKLMYESAVKNDAVMVSANLKGIALSGELVNNKNLERFKRNGVITPEEYGIPYSFYKNIFRRDFLIDNNLEFPDLLRGQDPVFLAEILTLVDEIPTVAVDLYGFRYSKRSDLLKMNTYRKRYDYIKHFRDTFDILENAGFNSMKKNYEDKLFKFIKAFHYSYTKEIKDIVYDVFADDEYILAKVGEIFIDPYVSLIIPVMDEEYLEESLSRILRQSLKKLEFVCICNFNSEILNEFSLKDSRIRVISQSFKSIGEAKNIGLKYATGNYVYFFNPKDSIKRKAMNLAYKSASKNDSDMVIFKAKAIEEDEISDIHSFFNYDEILDRQDFDDFSYSLIKEHIFTEGILLGSKFYKREFLMSNGDLLFEENFDFEDIIFHAKSMIRAGKISFINRFLFHHRGLISDSSKHSDVFAALDSVEEFLKRENLFDELESEFSIFKFDTVLQYVLAADSEEYFERARTACNGVDKTIIEDEYLMKSYDLLSNSSSFDEFKPQFRHLTLTNDLNKYKDAFEKINNDNLNLKNRHDKLKKSNDDLLNSKSWKVTKPFRKLKNF